MVFVQVRISANARMKTSSKGYALIRRNEGVRLVYYNDDAPDGGNCTWGVGTLAHLGPCTTEELRRTVTAKQVNKELSKGVLDAEKKVMHAVTSHQLTQDQFDAAVSFAYNVSTADLRKALGPANRGDMKDVAKNIMKYVYIYAHDRHGRRIGRGKISHGLLMRRRRESAPFQIPSKIHQ